MSQLDSTHRYYRMMLALFGLWLLCIVLFQYLVLPIFIAFTFGYTDALKFVTDKIVPEFTLGQQRASMFLSFFVVFIVPPFLLARIYRERLHTVIGSFSRPPSTLLVLGFSAVILSLPFVYMTNEVNQNLPLPDSLAQMEQMVDNTQTQLLGQPGWWAIVGNFFIIALMAPMAEEIFFRGALQNVLHGITLNPHLAIILAAFAFSAIHMEFAGFIPRAVLGIMFGYMAFWSGNIVVPIVCHAIFNGSQLALVYLLKQEVIGDPEKVSIPIYLSLFSVITTALILKQFYTRTIIKQNRPL